MRHLLFSITLPIPDGTDIPDEHTPEFKAIQEHPEVLAMLFGIPKQLIDMGVKIEFKVVEG